MRRLWVLGLAIGAGCAEDDTDSGATDQVTLSGRILNAADVNFGVEGADFCVDDVCTTTNALGDYTVDVAAGTEGVLRVSAPGHLSTRADLTVGDTDYDNLDGALIPDAFGELNATLAEIDAEFCRDNQLADGERVSLAEILFSSAPETTATTKTTRDATSG